MASSASHSISDDATFITALKQKPAVESKNADPEGMARVKNLHSQLLGVVGTLNEKVGAVLAKQEREFLRAYRAHMYTIQRELQTLRAKADDAAIQLAKNEKIRSLEAERDWYRSEALRLDQFCTGLKADVGYMRDKLLALEEDRSWLEGQAKAAMRANKILTARLNGSGLQGGISGSDAGTLSITMAGRPKAAAAAAGGANNLSNTNGGNTRNNLSSRGLTGISSRYSGASVDVDGLEADAADAQSLAQSRDTGAYSAGAGAGAGAVTGSLAMGEASLDQHNDLGGYNNGLSNSNSNGNGGNAGHDGAGAGGGGSAAGSYRPSVTGSRVVDSTALTEVEEVEEEGEDAEGSNEEDGDDDAAAGGVHARARNRRGLHRSQQQQQQQQQAAQQQRRSAGAASKFSSPPSKARPSPSTSRPPFGSNSTTGGGAQQSTARRTSQDTQLSAVQAGIAAALGLGGSGAGAASPARPAAGSAARAAQSLSSPVGQQQHQYSGVAGSSDQLVVAMQAQMEQLTSQVQRLNQRNAKLRAKNSRLVGGKSEAEQLLLAAIEETRKDVVRRRLKAATQDSGAAGGVRRSTDHRGAHGSNNNNSNQHGSTSPGGRSSSPAFGAAAAAAAATPSSITNPSMTQGAVEAALLGDSGLNATLELARAARVTPADFKAADRKALVAKLLEDDRVLERLKELLLAGAGDE